MAFADTLEQIQNFDLSEVDWDKVGVWPVWVKVFLSLLLAIAILVATYFLMVSDLEVQLQSVVQQETSLKKSFEDKSEQAANLEAYRQQMVEMEQLMAALVAQLPSDTEVPGLLEDIDDKGAGSGLSIGSIKLEPEKAAEFYIELPIKIEVQGGYHDFGTFVSGIASMPRIVTLHDYSIAPNKEGTQLDMVISAKTYRYKSTEAQ
ncbi:type 4a pilus biogenesis protein PilO [Simiduia agarivorans]|uniref:Type 4 fimbrial biogenesis protein PilO n=1 Tax=Simiduia agarivorans (strain DSM 21679 / JCM 13881 / BCRC 17597 / SA1) TaxID=1117647 RepID=K4KM23_SIMAS|nr:type 4a pilus biogenesis protein PilO [Simiduia agarivorans]AFV00082.2 type 4 fimbrial biogenesis protein PilO [Simiduia agarivorans SA1 = DSM 21679]